MRFVELLLGAAAATLVLAAPAQDATPTTSEQKRKGKFEFTGVNESGAEFGQQAIPGQLNKDYIWPANSTIDTLTDLGMNTFRIPIMMERAIPTTLTGSIDKAYFSGLTEIVNYITNKGAYAIVDPHNFGRYYGKVISDTAGFQAWWHTVASQFASNSLVIFDTNNEYHDMDNSLVAQLNQAAINGIRAAGAKKQYIFVEGNSYTGAWTWVSSGNSVSLSDLHDPAQPDGSLIIYEMHQYLDGDGSGTSETCVSSTIGQERITAATEWLKKTGKRGVIGEMAGGANANCITAVTGMLNYMEANSDAWMGWLWWGGGPWWGSYIYSMEPPNGVAYKGVLSSITKFI